MPFDQYRLKEQVRNARPGPVCKKCNVRTQLWAVAGEPDVLSKGEFYEEDLYTCPKCHSQYNKSGGLA